MKKENIFGGILAIIAALMGLIGHMVLFMNWYRIGMGADSAEPGCEILLKYIHPLMADLGMLGGVLFAISAYGYFTRRNWAFFLTVIALVLSLLGSWFINVPYMAAGLPPIYFPLFGHMYCSTSYSSGWLEKSHGARRSLHCLQESPIFSAG